MIELLLLFGGIILFAILFGVYLQLVFYVDEKRKMLKAQTELLAMIASRMGMSNEEINNVTVKAGITMKD